MYFTAQVVIIIIALIYVFYSTSYVLLKSLTQCNEEL